MKRAVVIAGVVGVVAIIAIIFWVGYGVTRQEAQVTQSTAAPETIAPLKKQQEFMIALGNDGEMGEKVGCGDSLIGLERWVSSEGDILANIYNDLLSLHDEKYNEAGLHNALWQSQLTVKSAIVANGTAKVALEGSIKQSGVCDTPRIIAQLEKPALQLSGISAVEVTINGKPLAQILLQ